MYKNILFFTLWFVCAMLTWNISTTLITAANTFLNLIGMFASIAFVLISIKTSCFTKISIKK